jgi:hypothetical protein
VTQVLGDGGHGGAQVVGQPVEIGPVIEQHEPVLFVGQHILAETGTEAGQGFADFGQPLLPGLSPVPRPT